GPGWPVVAVADLERRDRTNREPLLMDEAVGVAVRLDDEEGESVEPALYRILRSQAAARAEQESRRLLYVALTRARDHLILSAAAEHGGALDILAPGLQAGGIVRQVVVHEPGMGSYPAQPLATTSASDPQVDEAGLPLVAPGTASPVARFDAQAAVGPASSPDAWSAVLDLGATLDDTWLPVANALVAAGVRPPSPGRAGRWLLKAAAGPDSPALPLATYMLLAWRTQGGLLLVADPAAGSALADAVHVAGDLTASAAEVGAMSVARRPRGPSAGDEVARVWVLAADPLSDP